MTDTTRTPAPTSPAGAPSVAGPTPEESSIGQLVASASRDVSALVRHEIALAKSEVKVSVRNGGLGAALFGAAAFLLVLAIIMLSHALAYFLHMTGLDLAWCYSLVFLLYALIAAILIAVGVRKVKKVTPPERAIHQAQETKKALTQRG
jgi:hypothetical protein